MKIVSRTFRDNLYGILGFQTFQGKQCTKTCMQSNLSRLVEETIFKPLKVIWSHDKIWGNFLADLETPFLSDAQVKTLKTRSV